MITTHRPRNVNASRAAALLYGDWGTSKAYVIGLAFAIAGYASFWPILAVSILSLFVGLSYVLICKYHPKGGGVYTSLRHRAQSNKNWEWVAVLGAFFLVADYLVTAALSALSAFSYFGAPDAVLYSALFIVLIGVANYIGPRHTGTFALIIAIAAVSVFTVLALLSLPFLKQGWEHVAPLRGNPLTLWTQFCSVIVALSGVETIANTTPLMKLNRGSSPENPMVTRTSTPAIVVVMIEVIVYTTLFGLAATAIPHFVIHDQTLSAPGFSNLQNNILSYMARFFGTHLMGSSFGLIFSQLMSIIVGFILLSAVNTAMNGLIALQYLMASDGELPHTFRSVNKYGVPFIPLIIVALLPAIILLFVKKLVLLADLYAIGFVGAIAVNLGATSTDMKLPLRKWERVFMFTVAVVMSAIEITLFIQKSHARYFVLAIMVAGLALRQLAKFMQKRRELLPAEEAAPQEAFHGVPICVTKRLGRAIKAAIEESNLHNAPLNIVFVKELRVLAESDFHRKATHDPGAKKVIEYIEKTAKPKLVHFYYSVTDSFADIAVAYALQLEAPHLIVDVPISPIISAIRGNYVDTIRKHLPDRIPLIVVQ